MPSRRGALQALAERSGSDSDECMFDQTNLLERRRRRMDITRLRRSSATVSGHRLTVARTVNLCLSFFALGLCFVMPTATITGLQYRTSSTESAIEFIYTARYGGYIVGCFAGGFLFNWYNRQFLLFLALLATAIGVLVMPFCRVLATLMTCTCVAGVTMGLLDTGGNVWLLDLWGRKSAPFMQTMHFCFGLGALVAPLVAQPFVGAYNQLGAGGPGPVAPEGSSSSRTILSPMGPHSPSSVSLHSGSLRTSRDLHDGGQVGAMPLLNFSLPPTASTLPPVSLVRPLTTMTTTTTTTTTPGSLLSLAANTTLSPTLPSPASASSSSPLSSTVPVSLVTPTVTPQGSTTTQTARKKPQYAEAAPKPGKWDRTRISSAASSVATTAATPTARPTASNATGNVSVTSSVTTASTSSSCNDTRGCDHVGVAVPATTPAPGVIHEPLPTPTVRLQAGENSSISNSSFISGNSSHGSLPPPVEGDKTNSAVVSSPPSHLLPPRKNLPAATNVGTPSPTISTSTPSLPQRPSTTRPAMAAEVEDAKRRSKSHGKVLLTETEQQLQQQQQQQRQQQQQQQSLVQSGLGSHQPAAVPASHDESTTKGTASTVPTQESVRLPTDAGAGAGDDNDNDDDDVPKKHHSIKKVLPEGAERDSWLEATRKKIQESGKFEIAYGILAAYVLVVSIVFLAFLCMNPREGRSKQEDELDDAHAQAQASRMRLPLVVLMCSFFFLYMGVEAAVGQTLKSLFQRDALLTPLVTGEQLVYIFWGSFALARGASIFISMKASCRAMLIGDILLCLVAALTLVLGAPHQSGLLIAGIVFLAVGMASIIPTSLIWLERCMQVTNRLSSLLILSAAAGKMMIPELVTAFIRNTPMALMYVVLGVILLCAVNLVALCYVTSVRGEKYLVKPDRSLYQLASLDDDIDHWNQEGGGGSSGKTNSRQQPTPPPLSQHHQQPLQHNNSANLKRNKNNSFFYDRLNSLDS